MIIRKKVKPKGHDEPANIGNDEYVLRLFITGATPNSLRAITNIKSICELHLVGRYSLEIIDLYKDPQRAEKEQIVALPLLVKIQPAPQRKLIGDLSNLRKVLDVLSIK